MAPRFRVALLVGRQLTAEYEARDEQAAEDIARFLYGGIGLHSFEASPEHIVDVIIDQQDEGAAS